MLFALLAGMAVLPFSKAYADAGKIETLPATDITASSALLNGSVHLPELALTPASPYAREASVQYRFSFGSDPTLTFADHTSYSFALHTAYGQAVFSNIVNLSAGTTYYYRLEVTLPDNFVMVGNILSFSTAPNQGAVSAVHTLGATVNNDGSVTLNGQIDPVGSTPRYWFEYSTNPSLAFSAATPFESAANISGYIDVSQTIPNLSFGQLYYYRLAAETPYGTTYGDVRSFWVPAYGVPSNTVNYPGGFYSGGPAVLPGEEPSYQQNIRVIRIDSPQVVTAYDTNSPNPAVPARSYAGPSNPAGTNTQSAAAVSSALPALANSTALEPADFSCAKMQSSVDTYEVAPGGSVTYSVTVLNGCGAPMKDAALLLGLPANAVLVSSNNPSFQQSGQVMKYQLGSIPPGVSAQISIVLKISSSENEGEYASFASRLEYTDMSGRAHAIAAVTSAVGGTSGSAALPAVSAVAASIAGSFISFLGNTSFLFLIFCIIAGLLIYKFFFSGKVQHEKSVMKLGSLRIID